MSYMDMEKKVEIVKELLKAIHRGVSVNELRERFRDVLAQVSPFEIPLIEQKLVSEGVSIDDVLKLCDLHVELFREFLVSRELTGVPRGHPIDLFIRENEWILRQAEALSLYASALAKPVDDNVRKGYLDTLKSLLNDLRKIRLHYRKVQMLVFPYLERRGIVAVPRVLWGREDQVIVKLRQLIGIVARSSDVVDKGFYKLVSEKALELASEIGELVFRENKILFPAVYALFSEGEWVAIAEIANKMGWLIDVGEVEWRPSSRPLLPYEIDAVLTKEQVEKLPQEFKSVALAQGVKPDSYTVKRDGDIEFETGFLRHGEVEAIFRSLPLELTFADENGRVRFYTESILGKGFVRTKTIIGRRFEYCHPPRLEKLVKEVFEELKNGSDLYKEFWTKLGDSIIRVLIVAVRDRDGRFLGALEIVEDMTNIVNNPEEVKKKIMVL